MHLKVSFRRYIASVQARTPGEGCGEGKTERGIAAMSQRFECLHRRFGRKFLIG